MAKIAAGHVAHAGARTVPDIGLAHGARRIALLAIALVAARTGAAFAPVSNRRPNTACRRAPWRSPGPSGFPITNSMVVSWIVAVGLIVFARLATRRMTQVPGGAQNFLEWLVESLYGFLEGIIGAHLVRRTFWFFGTIFIFILAANWSASFPASARSAGATRRPKASGSRSRCSAARTPTSTSRWRWRSCSSRAGSSGRSRKSASAAS